MKVDLSGLITAWDNIRAVIFDVDGTLYDQRALRLLMCRDLVWYYLRHPFQCKDLQILLVFRRLREGTPGPCEFTGGLLEMHCLFTAERTGASRERVETCIRRWMLTYPLRYLRSLRCPGLLEFCHELKRASILTAAFSDYPVEAKLKALGMPDMPSVCTSDSNINRMKPHPKGLIVLLEKLRLSADSCLLIGDREDRDGACAQSIGMNYLIRKKLPSKPHHFDCYRTLSETLIEANKRKSKEQPSFWSL